MSEMSATNRPLQATPPAQPGAARRPYQRPAILSITRLSTRAGSTIKPLGEPADPLNTPNDYGL